MRICIYIRNDGGHDHSDAGKHIVRLLRINFVMVLRAARAPENKTLSMIQQVVWQTLKQMNRPGIWIPNDDFVSIYL